MNFGRAIRILRTAYGLSQTALAQRTSIGTSQLSAIESNERQPSLRVIQEICAALGVPQHLLTLLASTPEELEATDPKYVAELARALLRLLVNVGEQRTLPMPTRKTRAAKRKRTA